MPTLSGFGSLAGIPEGKITDNIARRVLAGEKGMMVWWNIKANTHIATHSHPHEQIVWLLKGKLEAYERRVTNPGDLAVIPGGVEHEMWWADGTISAMFG